MASLQELSSIIYHEKQQPGSMLCAQHALNSLLQGNYFTAPDLSDIAGSLDRLEEAYDNANAGNTSTNMDDTGFFSIQVLEDALNVWGLTLVRWRSERMKPYQDQPHTQLAFILNYQQHWFTLRRFGPADANLDADAGEGHWFNLNSFLYNPEWVGKLYLGMVLQQAEKDGYSVFAVAQMDPTAHLALARTAADQLASTLPEPTSATPITRLSTSTDPANASTSSAPLASNPRPIEGFEDEDMELQAALQASLMRGSELVLPHIQRPPTVEPSDGIDAIASSGARLRTRMDAHAETTEAVDPIAASLARNKAIMDQMRQEQEMAQRELYEEEVARLGRLDDSGQPGLHDRTEQEQEVDMLRRAIAESRASARAEKHDNFEEDDEDIDDMESNKDYQPPTDIPHSYSDIAARADRVYDDDDAELQAALKASLENVPDGFTMPHPTIPAPTNGEAEVEDVDNVSEAGTSVTSSDHPPSVDEIRRMRLARFGL